MTTRQIDARFKGKCACGATVMPQDRVNYDTESKKVVGCTACGTKDNRYQGPRRGASQGPHAWKYDPGTTQGESLRSNAHEIARLLHYIGVYTQKVAQATTEAQRSKFEKLVLSRRQDLADTYKNIKDFRMQVPTERDIEAATQKLLADIERRRREEEDE